MAVSIHNRFLIFCKATSSTFIKKGSGISVEVTRERGYKGILGEAEVKALGFSKWHCRTSGILMPIGGDPLVPLALKFMNPLSLGAGIQIKGIDRHVDT